MDSPYLGGEFSSTWGRLLSPVVARMNTAGLEGLPGDISEQIGQFAESMGGIMNIMNAITSYMFGTQLGGALATLSQQITCSSEMGIPLDSAGTAALLPTLSRSYRRTSNFRSATSCLPRCPRSRLPAAVDARTVACPAPFGGHPRPRQWHRGGLLQHRIRHA
ncbi:MAG: zinc-dependent metalloprotease [Lawsonella clevelandensis]